MGFEILICFVFLKKSFDKEKEIVEYNPSDKNNMTYSVLNVYNLRFMRVSLIFIVFDHMMTLIKLLTFGRYGDNFFEDIMDPTRYP